MLKKGARTYSAWPKIKEEQRNRTGNWVRTEPPCNFILHGDWNNSSFRPRSSNGRSRQGTSTYNSSMERTDTKMDRELLEALRAVAAEEGREEYEVLEDAARFYLERGPHSGARDAVQARVSINEVIERARRRRERAGLEELPEEEAIRIAVEEQHAHRRGE